MQTNTHNPISLTAERLLASDKVTGMIMLFLEVLINLDMPEALQVAAVNAQPPQSWSSVTSLKLSTWRTSFTTVAGPKPRAHSRSCSLLWLVNRGCRPQQALSGPRWNCRFKAKPRNPFPTTATKSWMSSLRTIPTNTTSATTMAGPTEARQ